MPLPDRITLLVTGATPTTLLFTGGRGPAGSGSSGGGGSSFLTQVQVDRTGITYWYYGGLDADGAWCVQRYNITQNPTVRTTATNGNNSGVTSISSAWAGRTGLTYA